MTEKKQFSKPNWLALAQNNLLTVSKKEFSLALEKKQKHPLLAQPLYRDLFRSLDHINLFFPSSLPTTSSNNLSSNKLSSIGSVSSSQPEFLFTLEDALADEKLSLLIKQHFQRSHTHDLLSARNKALFSQAYVFVVPKGKILSNIISLNIDFIPNTTTYLLIIAQDSSQVSFVEKCSVKNNLISNKNIQATYTVDVWAQNNAHVQFTSLHQLVTSIHLFTSRNTFVSKNANVTLHDSGIGTQVFSLNSTIHLLDEGALGYQYGSFFIGANQQYYINQASYHYAPLTESDIKTKAVVLENASALFEGLVRMFAGTHQAKGFEKIDVISLSPTVRVRAIPTLEIDTNDVECSHGATIGQLDKNKLFYLQSRGLKESLAKQLLIQGFFTPQLKESLLSQEEQKIMLTQITQQMRDTQ